MPAIRADDNASALGDGLAVFRMTLDTDHTRVLDDNFLDGKTFADFSAGFGRGINQQFVQDRSPRAIGHGRVFSAGRAADCEGAKVEGIDADRRASGRL